MSQPGFMFGLFCGFVIALVPIVVLVVWIVYRTRISVENTIFNGHCEVLHGLKHIDDKVEKLCTNTTLSNKGSSMWTEVD